MIETNYYRIVEGPETNYYSIVGGLGLSMSKVSSRHFSHMAIKEHCFFRGFRGLVIGLF